MRALAFAAQTTNRLAVGPPDTRGVISMRTAEQDGNDYVERRVRESTDALADADALGNAESAAPYARRGRAGLTQTRSAARDRDNTKRLWQLADDASSVKRTPRPGQGTLPSYAGTL